MFRAIQMFKKAHPQTKLFIFMIAIYMMALAWTTTQAYLRLSYDQTDLVPPIIIKLPPSTKK